MLVAERAWGGSEGREQATKAGRGQKVRQSRGMRKARV